MGTYELTLNVHLPGLANYAVHPSPALGERYRVGIPIALLTSQLAIGNCTKRKCQELRIGMKNFEFDLVK